MEKTGCLGSKVTRCGPPVRFGTPGPALSPGSLVHQGREDIRPRIHSVAALDAHAASQGYINLGVARQPHVGAALTLADALSVAHECDRPAEVAWTIQQENDV